MKTETDEDRLTLGMSKVAAPLQLTTPRVTKTETDEDEDRLSGDEQSGSSLTADHTPE